MNRTGRILAGIAIVLAPSGAATATLAATEVGEPIVSAYIWYACGYIGGGRYSCEGDFVEVPGGVCRIEWTDDDWDSSPYDANARILRKACLVGRENL